MEYTTLGRTGFEVSRICLGCMSFGSKEWQDWVLEEEESLPIIERAIDLGINFFDTANIYSHGESERILGTVLPDIRRQAVVATKVWGPMRESGEYDDDFSQGLDRKNIQQQLESSLKRLGVDCVDLYQIHRWDSQTPIASTLRTLDDLISQGHIRHIGASSMWAHQFSRALETSKQRSFDRFQTMQNHYNLVYREEEREMLPLCRNRDVAVIPWSPLAKGYLSRPHDEYHSTLRGQTDHYIHKRGYEDHAGQDINQRVQELAERKGATMAQIALAWVLRQNPVASVIVGPTEVEHIEQAAGALELDLSDEECAFLEEPYEPVPIKGHE